MTDIVLSLGAAVVKAACKVWLKDHEFAADASASVIDIVNARVAGTRERRHVRRLFEDLEEAVAERLDTTLKHEFRMPAGERDAAVLAVADTFDRARLLQEDIFAADLDPLFLERNIRADRPAATRDLAPPAVALYDRLLGECCTYVIEVARDLPSFHAGAFTEILQRQSQILEAVRELLQRAPSIEAGTPDAAFTARYRYQVANILDRLELFGVTAADSVRRYPLSLAYIRLSVLSHGRSGAGPTVIDDVLARHSRLFLRGDAGSGKTTLLQWLAVRSARGDFSGRLTRWNDSIPFFVPLRRWVGRALPSPGEFLSQVGRHIADEMPEGWVHRRLTDGRALVLVDGIDELPEDERAAARDWLRALTAAYPDARYVVTSRPTATSEGWLGAEGFASAELQQMSRPDIEQFVRHWHAAIGSSRVDVSEPRLLQEHEETLLDALHAKRHLRALAVNPLLCALLCALHLDRRTQLPRDRMELYGVALEMLLERRDIERRINGQGPDLSYTDKILILQDLAYWLIRNGLSDAPLDRAVERVQRRLVSLRRLSADPDTVFRQLLVRSGLLREPVVGRIDFVHRTFQEYLAARAAVEADDIEILVANAHQDQWRGVVVMAAGHAQPRQREELLRSLLHRGDNEGDGWQTLHVLAVACLETSRELAPGMYEQIQLVARELLPPRSRSDVQALAQTGEFVLDLLADRPVTTEEQAVATIRLAAKVGGEAALAVISRCAGFASVAVGGELLTAWREFDTDRYARRVLADSPNAVELSLDSADQLGTIRHMTSLKRLHLDRVPGDLELGEVLPPQRLERLAVSGCAWLRRLRPELDAAQLRSLTSLEITGCGLTSLRELSHWAGTLTELTVWSNNDGLTDLASLPALPELEILSYAGSGGSLEPLLGSPKLRRISLWTAMRPDLTPLRDLAWLEYLDLCGHGTFDLSPLAGNRRLIIRVREPGARVFGADSPAFQLIWGD